MMDQEERRLFTETLRQVVDARTGPDLDAELSELGWHDAMADDPRVAISVLFDCQGAVNATSSALDDVLCGALGLEGAVGSAVVLPAPGRWEAPGELDGDRFAVRGLGTARMAAGGTVVVVAGSPAGDIALVVKAAELTVRPVQGIDPNLGVVEVTGTAGDAGARSQLPPGAWAAGIALGQLALAHQLVGAAGTMLELARTHALDRVQFGRPIGSFQAVRHRLAETLVAVEAARAGLDAAWDDGSPQAAATAKALAGRGARTAARHCQQVLAGIGFTTEHPFHRYLWRVLALDELLGSTRTLTRQLGRDLLASRQLPPAPPL